MSVELIEQIRRKQQPTVNNNVSNNTTVSTNLTGVKLIDHIRKNNIKVERFDFEAEKKKKQESTKPITGNVGVGDFKYDEQKIKPLSKAQELVNKNKQTDKEIQNTIGKIPVIGMLAPTQKTVYMVNDLGGVEKLNVKGEDDKFYYAGGFGGIPKNSIKVSEQPITVEQAREIMRSLNEQQTEQQEFDKLSNTQKFIQKTQGAVRGALVGENDKSRLTTGSKVADIAAGLTGAIASTADPVTGIKNLALIEQAAKAAIPTAGGLTKALVGGAVAGNAYGVSQGLGQGKPIGEIAKNAAIDTALGAVADAGLYGLGEGITALRSAAANSKAGQLKQIGKFEEGLKDQYKNIKPLIRTTDNTIAPQTKAAVNALESPTIKNTVDEGTSTIQTKNVAQKPTESVQTPYTFKYETDPQSISQKTFYHGTGTKGLTADKLDPNATKVEGLFGSGIYLTDNPEIAKGYAKARGKRTGQEVIYQSVINPQKMIDLEKPLPQDVATEYLNLAADVEGSGGDYIFQTVRKMVNDNESGYNIYRKITEAMSNGEITKSEATEILDNFQIKLKDLGYDGYTHIGGKLTNKNAHQVAILFDPNDVYGVGRKTNISKFEEIIPTQNVSQSSNIEVSDIFKNQSDEIFKLSKNTDFSQYKTVDEVDSLIDNLTRQKKTLESQLKIEDTPEVRKQLFEINIQLFGAGEYKRSKFYDTVQKYGFFDTELKNEVAKRADEFEYSPINNKDTYNAAKQQVDNDITGTTAKFFNTDAKNATADDIATGYALIDSLQKQGNYSTAADVALKMKEFGTKAGQTVQSFAIVRRLSPEGMLNYAVKELDKAGIKNIPPEFLGRVTEGIKAVNEVTNEQDLIDLILKQSADRNINVSNFVLGQLKQNNMSRLKDIATAQVLGMISDELPVSIARKLSTYQAMSHLINIPTSLRNIFSNISFDTLRTISNNLSIPVDRLIGKFTGQSTVGRSKTLLSADRFRAGMDRAKQSAVDIGLGINTLSDNSKYNIPLGRTFKKGPLGKAERLLSYSLQTTDEFFKGATIQDTAQSIARLSGLDNPTDEIMEIAKQEAAYRAFQDNSLPATLLQGAKELMNKIGTGKKIAGSVLKSTKEFGAGDFLIKYTKVPGNLISRGIEYSPLGYLKTLSILNEARKTGVLNQRDLAMTIGSATTGSMMIGMAMMMNRLGLLVREDKDRSKNALALDRAEGLGNYKINMSGIGRLLTGEDPKLKAGDNLVSYNWLQPVSTSLSVGAAMDSAIQKEGITPKAIFKDGGEAALEEMLDIPTLFVIRKMTYADGVYDVATTPISEGLGGFIPAPARQIGQGIDPYVRDTKGADALQTGIKKTINNIPFASQTLKPRLTPWGQPMKNQNNAIERLITPSLSSEYTPSGVTSQLKKIEEATGETRQYPSITPPKELTKNDGKKVTLTKLQQQQYIEEYGKQYLEKLSKYYSGANKNASPEAQMKVINKLQSQSRESAKLKVLKPR